MGLPEVVVIMLGKITRCKRGLLFKTIPSGDAGTQIGVSSAASTFC